MKDEFIKKDALEMIGMLINELTLHRDEYELIAINSKHKSMLQPELQIEDTRSI